MLWGGWGHLRAPLPGSRCAHGFGARLPAAAVSATILCDRTRGLSTGVRYRGTAATGNGLVLGSAMRAQQDPRVGHWGWLWGRSRSHGWDGCKGHGTTYRPSSGAGYGVTAGLLEVTVVAQQDPWIAWHWGWLWGHSSTCRAGYGGTTASMDGLAIGTQQDPWMGWYWGQLWGHSSTCGAAYRGTTVPMDGLALGLAIGAQQHL